jgi:putative peptidoglycan lipid II flippase
VRRQLSAATQTLAGAAVMITAVTILSRLLGFGRWLAQASQLGTGGVASAYATANVLPNVLYEVAAGGALAGAVVPLLAGPLLRKARIEVNEIASALLTWAVVALVPLGALLAVFSRPIIGLLPGVGSGAQADIASYFLIVFAVQVPLYGIGVVLSGILQANRRFFWPAAAPMFSSIVVICAYIVFGRLADGNQGQPELLSSAALEWLAWGTTVGVAAMSLPLFVPAYRTGISLRPTLRFPPGIGKRARHLAFAGVGALIAQQVSVIVVMFSALKFGGEATFNVYQYSQAVYVLPYAVLAVPLATSAFPRLAARADADDHSGFAALSAVATRAVLAVSAAGAATLIAVAPAVESFFGFTKGGAEGMAVSIAWSAPGLIGFALLFHLTRTLYSLDAGRLAVFAAAAGWLIVSLLAVVVPAIITDGTADRSATLASLGFANSVGMAVAGVLLLAATRRRAGAESIARVGRSALVLLIGVSAGAWLGHALCSRALPDDASAWIAVAVGVLAAVVAVAVVAAAIALGDRTMLAVVRTRDDDGSVYAQASDAVVTDHASDAAAPDRSAAPHARSGTEAVDGTQDDRNGDGNDQR